MRLHLAWEFATFFKHEQLPAGFGNMTRAVASAAPGNTGANRGEVAAYGRCYLIHYHHIQNFFTRNQRFINETAHVVKDCVCGLILIGTVYAQGAWRIFIRLQIRVVSPRLSL